MSRQDVSRRYEPLPDAAYCTDLGCRWQDPVSVTGVTLDEHGDAVDCVARKHAAWSGHEVRITRTQVVILRPAPAGVTA